MTFCGTDYRNAPDAEAVVAAATGSSSPATGCAGTASGSVDGLDEMPLPPAAPARRHLADGS